MRRGNPTLSNARAFILIHLFDFFFVLCKRPGCPGLPHLFSSLRTIRVNFFRPIHSPQPHT